MKYEQGSSIAQEIMNDMNEERFGMVEHSFIWEVKEEKQMPKTITTMSNFYMPYCI